MFYKSGVDITNDRQMFEFLKNHFEYYTANSWNRRMSIANNVKLHRLNLSGNWSVAYSLLANGEYETINCMIADWRREHPMYEVFFNGRSGGYLVLYDNETGEHVLPESILESDTYVDYKEYCREYYGSVKANRNELVFFTKLVQDFDKLCDVLRAYCDELSNLAFEVVEMEKSVERFNTIYEDDLYYLGFKNLHCDGNGCVDISEIQALDCLKEAFLRIADRRDSGYYIKFANRDNTTVSYVADYL